MLLSFVVVLRVYEQNQRQSEGLPDQFWSKTGAAQEHLYIKYVCVCEVSQTTKRYTCSLSDQKKVQDHVRTFVWAVPQQPRLPVYIW